MCIVSMVMQQWWPPGTPDPFKLPDAIPSPGIPAWPPNAVPWPTIEKDPTLAAQMLEVLKALEAIDKRLGLIEQCKVSEPEKEQIKGRLRKIAANAVVPWGTWQEREALSRQAKIGDRWLQIKSGRVAVIVDNERRDIKLQHENGRTTWKWRHYFAQEFTPETPPSDPRNEGQS